MGKSLSNKYGQKILDSANSTTDALKTTSKRVIQETAESTGDLIGIKIADKITSVSTELRSKKSSKEKQNDEIEIPKQRYISPIKNTTNYWLV